MCQRDDDRVSPAGAQRLQAQALMFVPIVPLLVATGALAAQDQIGVLGTLLALTAGVAAGALRAQRA